MLDLEYAKEYLRIDDEYENDFILDLIETSGIYIDSMVGEEYKADEKLVKLADVLQLKLISDMYETRSADVPSNIKQDRIVTSILDKLSLCGDMNG